MIFFDSKPSALSDGSPLSLVEDSLSEMRSHRSHLIEQIEREIRSSKVSLESVETRIGWSKKNPNQSQSWNSLGEFQQCLSHRLDLFIVQFHQLDEIIRHFEGILAPKTEQKEEQNEQPEASQRVRKAAGPERKRSTARRPRKPDGR